MDENLIYFLGKLTEADLIKLHLCSLGIKNKRPEIFLLKSEANKIIEEISPEKCPKRMMKKMGISLIRSKTQIRYPNLIIRAFLYVEKSLIEIFEDELELLWGAVNSYKNLNLKKVEIEDIILTHELYHLLGTKNEINRISEVKASLFTMRFLSLQFYPYLLDLIQIFHEKPFLFSYYKDCLGVEIS